MKPANKLRVTRESARRHGCRMCKYCDGIHYYIGLAEDTIRNYKEYKGMDFNFLDGAFYVKTEIGCWKIAYSRAIGKLVLFHMNYMPKDFDFTHPNTLPYHRQTDMREADSIAKVLNYIYEHDRYKMAVNRGEQVVGRSSKRARHLAVRSDKKRSRKNLEYLFRVIEREHPEYKTLSCC